MLEIVGTTIRFGGRVFRQEDLALGRREWEKDRFLLWSGIERRGPESLLKILLPVLPCAIIADGATIEASLGIFTGFSGAEDSFSAFSLVLVPKVGSLKWIAVQHNGKDGSPLLPEHVTDRDGVVGFDLGGKFSVDIARSPREKRLEVRVPVGCGTGACKRRVFY